MKTRFFLLLTILIALLIMTGCDSRTDKDEELYRTVVTKRDTVPTPTPKPNPDPEPDSIETWTQVVEKTFKVNDDRNCTSTITVQSNKGNLKEFVLKYTFGVEISAPAKVWTTTPTTTKGGMSQGDQIVTGRTRDGQDSIWSLTTPWTAQTNLWTINLKTTRKEGRLSVQGKWEPYLNGSERVTFVRMTNEDLGQVESNDSIYKVERCTSTFSVILKDKAWEITSTTDVYRFVKVKTTPDPDPEADVWVPGLQKYLCASRVYRMDTQAWCDAYCFESSNKYWFVIANYKVSSDKETFVSTEVTSIEKGGNGAAYVEGKYNGVVYAGPGLFMPAIVSSDGARGWTVIGQYQNGTPVKQIYAAGWAVSSGIKNFLNGDTAYPKALIDVAAEATTVGGKVFITLVGKTSVHTFGPVVVGQK